MLLLDIKLLLYTVYFNSKGEKYTQFKLEFYYVFNSTLGNKYAV
jgi:hypothetical protein